MAPQRKKVTYSTHPTRAARSAHARGDREFRTYDTSYIQPKKSKAPAIVALVLVVVVVLALVLIIRSCVAGSAETTGDLLPEGEQVIVEVVQGEGAKDVGQALADAGLISSSSDFVDLANSKDAAGSLIPGTYVFTGGDTADSILQSLLAGPASTGFTLTIPEGYTRSSIADAVEKTTDGLITADEFLAASADAGVYANEYSFLTTAQDNSLEGFLFPKTYEVTAADDATSVVKMMLDQFQTETATLDWSYPEGRGMDLYKTVILASIVEKESDDDHRKSVASVFYNRLASDRPYLESDATTAYEVGHDPSADEVHDDSEYSTYTHEGLPPTPICSPSLDSILAVCSPDETNYMFFYFAENDEGKTVYAFSETYEEHQQAIASL